MTLPALPPRFLATHLLWPLHLFALLMLCIENSGLDLWVADQLYAWSGSAWTLRDAWLTEGLIHLYGRKLIAMFGTLLLLLLADSYFHPRLKRYRIGFWYLLTSALATVIVINATKYLSHVDCPWDLQRYGGEFPYVHKFAPHPGTFRVGNCFPAGHASGAYGWFGLYYLCLMFFPQWRWRAFSGVLLLGVIFGIGQQLRGAHFISHDLWSLALCWFTASLVYWGFVKFWSRAGVATPI